MKFPRTCKFAQKPGYTCEGYVSRNKPYLCDRHLAIWTYAVKQGRIKVGKRFSAKYFSDESIGERYRNKPRILKCMLDGQKGFTCDYGRNEGYLYLREPNLCGRHYHMGLYAVQKGQYPDLRSIPSRFYSDHESFVRHGWIGRKCKYLGLKGYTCRSGRQHLGHKDPDLCPRHYRFAFYAVKDGNWKTISEVPDSYFTDQARAEWRKEAKKRSLEDLRRKLLKQDRKCKFYGREGWVCSTRKTRLGADYLYIVKGRKLCCRHYGMIRTIRSSKKFPPDEFFSEYGRALVRERNARRMVERRRREIAKLRERGLVRTRRGPWLVIARRPEGGCKFYGKRGFVCGGGPGVLLMCWRHYDAAKRMVFRGTYNSREEIPDWEFSEEAFQKRRHLASIKAHRKASRKLTEAGLIRIKAASGKMRLVTKPEGGCRLHGKEGFVCGGPRRGLLLCQRHYHAVQMLVRKGKYRTGWDVPNRELSQEGFMLRRIEASIIAAHQKREFLKKNNLAIVMKDGERQKISIPTGGCKFLGKAGYRCGPGRKRFAFLCGKHSCQVVRLIRKHKYPNVHAIPDAEFLERRPTHEAV